MNSTANYRRIHNEVRQIEKQASEYEKMFKLSRKDDNIYHWQAVIFGPVDSLYEGYKFELDIHLPDNYPFSPPNVKFLTPIQHVNVNAKGDICLDILKNNWTPSLNIQSVIVSLGQLLTYPNTDDPFNSDLAELYRTNKKEYTKRIKEHCQKNAIANDK